MVSLAIIAPAASASHIVLIHPRIHLLLCQTQLHRHMIPYMIWHEADNCRLFPSWLTIVTIVQNPCQGISCHAGCSGCSQQT